MEPENVLHAYVNTVVRGLVSGGLRHLVLAPGGRSAPLAMLAAEQPEITVWRQIDERAAAYFALGMARARREPVALLCTSGTAAANFHPAVVEAYHARGPLLVLTADRPHELRDNAAPQTIDQLRLYGTHVKWFHELAPPSAEPRLLRYAGTTACRAVQLAAAAPAGPVHLNFPLRKPLVPVARAAAGSGQQGAGGGTGALPQPRLLQGGRMLDPGALDLLAGELAGSRRGLIVCGMQEDPAFPAAVARLAAALDLPILADPLSGVRCGNHDRRRVVDAYDAMLRRPRVVEALRPDLVIRFGAPTVSQALTEFLEAHAGGHRHLVVDGGDGWRDPLAAATEMLHAQPAHFCQELADRLGRGAGGRRSGPARDQLPLRAAAGEAGAREAAATASPVSLGWTGTWLQAGRRVRHSVSQAMAAFDRPFAGRVVDELAPLLPEGTLLYVGNSMPVRDVDGFLPSSPHRLRLMANRGVNGIDGVASSALGAAAVWQRPVVLLAGDLTFYHDLGGLLAAHTYALDLTVVLVNNDGGGIFSFLPQADGDAETFELLFGTPTGLDFAPAVAGTFGGTFTRPADWSAFRAAVSRSLQTPGLGVIEVTTGRAENVTMHEAVWAAAAEAVAGVLWPAGEQ